MDSLSSAPGNAYDYIYGQFGMIGVIVAGLVLLVSCLTVVFWFDRRK
jgi:hypothetical protein